MSNVFKIHKSMNGSEELQGDCSSNDADNVPLYRVVITSHYLFQFGSTLTESAESNQNPNEGEMVVDPASPNDTPLYIMLEELPVEMVKYLCLQISC